MSSLTARTGVSKRPDWQQKWQSSGQPPVLIETIPSTSTSGPHQRIRTSWASASASSTASSGQLEDLERLRLVEADAPLEDLLAGDVEDHAGISRVGCSTPSGSRPRTGAIVCEVVEVAQRGEVRVARPGADHDAEAGEAAALDRLDGQRRVVERAEAGAGDDDQRRVEQFRHVGDRPAAERHEQPAGALDDHLVVVERLHERRRSRAA